MASVFFYFWIREQLASLRDLALLCSITHYAIHTQDTCLLLRVFCDDTIRFASHVTAGILVKALLTLNWNLQVLTAIRPFKISQSPTRVSTTFILIQSSKMTPPPAWLSHPLTNVASFFILGQVAKRLNLENPDNLFYARAVYVMVQATIIGLSYWLISKVEKKNGKRSKSIYNSTF